jgi:hypothetical protein
MGGEMCAIWEKERKREKENQSEWERRKKWGLKKCGER